MPIELTCANCGKLFSVPPSTARAGRKFCSHQCQVVYNRGSNNPNWKGGLVVGACLVCGAETQVKPSHAAKGAGKFCSPTCMGKWRTQTALGYDPAKTVVKQCKVCGKEIFVKQSHKDIQGTYCSTECMAEGYRRELKGHANPNYRHGMAYAQEYSRVKNADQRAKSKGAQGSYSPRDIVSMMHHQCGECAACGGALKNGYEVDHRIPLSRGGSNYVGNLQLLCKRCNRKKHDMFVIEFRYRRTAI